MEEIDIPQYFLCPISLQIMKDPVTAVTGITYDRESIQHWLAIAASDEASAVCPVTKQPLPRSSDLTPNHMLRCLIQAWCVANSSCGIDRIPTPRSPLERSVVLKLIRDVHRRGADSLRQLDALRKLDTLAAEDEKNRRCMAEAGVAEAMVLFIVSRFKEGRVLGVEEASRILKLTWTKTDEIRMIVGDNSDFVQTIMWILKLEIEDSEMINSLVILKYATEIASSGVITNLKLEFFEELMKILTPAAAAVRAVLHILIKTCPYGRNRSTIVELGAVFDLIEMEMTDHDKKTTELRFGLLAQLCACAGGRQQLLRHAGGMAVVAERLLRNSSTTDDRALCVMESVARSAATPEVVAEMVRVGAVAKLCMVMQADCADYLKKKATEILRLHSGEWSNSSCIQVYLLARNPR